MVEGEAGNGAQSTGNGLPALISPYHGNMQGCEPVAERARSWCAVAREALGREQRSCLGNLETGSPCRRVKGWCEQPVSIRSASRQTLKR